MKAPVADSTCGEFVVLLHGLARTRRSMQAMAQALLEQGYRVVNTAYPSRHQTIDELAARVIPRAMFECQRQGATRIHFVTHSLGGILVRRYFNRQTDNYLGRVVMLGPPNQGSEAVDRLRDLPGFGLLNGPAGRQLGTGADSVPRSLGPVTFELGVIAGTHGINPWLARLIPGDNDGKVSVESTRVAGMTDFIQLPCSHTFMMKSPRVIQQTIFFLKNGMFDR